MSDIPTHELVAIQSKVKIVMRDWITGADDEKIQRHYYDGGSVDKLSGDVHYSGDAMIGADHEAIKAVVVSVGGSHEDVVAAILALPVRDTKQILDEVKKITNPLAIES